MGLDRNRVQAQGRAIPIGRRNFGQRRSARSAQRSIIAFVEKLGGILRRIASLYLGRSEAPALSMPARLKTGYTLAAAREVRERLDPLIIGKSPLSHRSNKPKATWVEPRVYAEVDYSGVTDDGLLRERSSRACRKPPGMRRKS